MFKFLWTHVSHGIWYHQMIPALQLQTRLQTNVQGVLSMLIS